MRAFRIPALLLTAVFLLLLVPAPLASAQTGVDPVNALNPLRFEDGFLTGYGDPPHPGPLPNATGNGWVDTVSGGGTVEVRADCGATPSALPGVDLPCLFVRELALGGHTGTSSRNITKDLDEFTWGFMVRVEAFRSVSATKVMSIIATSDQTLGSGNYFGIVIDTDGSIRAVRSGGTTDTGVDLVLNVYYHFLLDVNGLGFELFVNRTTPTGPPFESLGSYVIAGAWAGFSKWNIEVATGGGGRLKTTEYASGVPNIVSEPVTSGFSLVPYDYFMRTNSSFPGVTFTSLLFSLGFLSGDPETFLLDGNTTYGLRVTSFTGPPEGAFEVNLSASNRAGGRSQVYTLTLEAGGIEIVGLEWLRNFGAAWVIFLIFVAIAVVVVRMLWRGATGKKRR